jgi:hypothetical protein
MMFPRDRYVYDAKQQKWFVNEWERRMSDLEKMRLAAKFGKKDEYSDWECKAMFEELERAGLNEEGSDLDAIEALFKKLNEADEAARTQSTATGSLGLKSHG